MFTTVDATQENYLVISAFFSGFARSRDGKCWACFEFSGPLAIGCDVEI
jgi:hypothetical protein